VASQLPSEPGRRAALLALVLLPFFCTSPLAAPGDDVVAAINRGDFAAALHLLQPRAEQGDAVAQYQLGTLYETGQGVPRDDAAAAAWYRRAALSGHAGARYRLARMYLTGRGVSHSPAEAARWLRLAATQGVAAAQFDLATLFAGGTGVKRDPVQAHAWFDIAAASFQASDPAQSAQAVHERDAIAATMTPAQIDAARRLAAAFRPAP
jgi:TPR repeat protein